MLEKEKMSKNELEEVAGGKNSPEKVDINNLPDGWTVTRKCRKCGKEYKTISLAMSMIMVGPEADEYRYYYNLCDECAKKYPYKKISMKS